MGVVIAIKKGIVQAYSLLSNPESSFKKYSKQSLEEVVQWYLLLLVTLSLVAGIARLIFTLSRAIYIDIARTISIDYGPLLNYTFGQSLSLTFLIIFVGTFAVFFVALLIKPFFRSIKLADYFKVTLLALAPTLLFGWIPPTPIPFLVWSLVLMHVGKKHIHTKKTVNSVEQRY